MTTDRSRIETLDDLATHLRQSLPQPKAITRLEHLNEIKAIRFHWQGRDFLVRLNLDVLELRGNNIYITGTSILIQSVLTGKNKNEKVLTAIEEVLKEAEDLIGTKYRAEAGLRLLATAKAGLMKLAGIKRPLNRAGAAPALVRA